MIRKHIFLTKPQLAMLGKESKRTGVSVSGLIRLAIQHVYGKAKGEK